MGLLLKNSTIAPVQNPQLLGANGSSLLEGGGREKREGMSAVLWSNKKEPPTALVDMATGHCPEGPI
eukprot:scaffold135_cov160-Skeletonema_dohrnii-CCMP3373.AAC.11